MEHVSHLVSTYGYAIVFVLVFLDQAAVSVPSPPFVAALGGLAASGRYNIYWAFVVVFAAAFLADAMWYVIGTRGVSVRLPSIAGWKMWNLKLANSCALLKSGVLSALITVKFTLLPSALAPFVAGSAGVFSLRFLSMAGIANSIFSAVYLVLGFTANAALLKSGRGLTAAIVGCWLLLLLGVPVLQWTVRRLRRPC